MTVETPPMRLHSVQALRGIAALLVVLFHAAEIWRDGTGGSGPSGPWDQGWAGVDLFFVISGFVMVWVASDRPAGPRTAGRFLFDRATRIYPLWWVFCALMALYFFVGYGQPASPSGTGPDRAWGFFAQSMALWPMGERPVLGVGWTLIYEMGFYLLFAALLYLPAKVRPFGLLLWGVLLVILMIVRPFNDFPDGFLDLISSPICLQFCFGATIGYGLKRPVSSAGIGWIVVLIGGLGFSVLLFTTSTEQNSVTLIGRTLTFGVTAALLLAGLVWVEKAGKLSVPFWLAALGDASYTLYLCHFLILLALRRLGQSAGLFTESGTGSFTAFMVIGTVLSVVASLILYRMLERPLLSASRRVFGPRKVEA